MRAHELNSSWALVYDVQNKVLNIERIYRAIIH